MENNSCYIPHFWVSKYSTTHQNNKKDKMMDGKLTFSWRCIGQAAGRNPSTLARAHSMGTLPVVPQRVGRHVAMTPSQIEQLRKGGRK